jgi:hypothetical protein
MVIFNAVFLPEAASAKKVTKTNRSSILVMTNVLHAVPRVLPNCMIKELIR